MVKIGMLLSNENNDIVSLLSNENNAWMPLFKVTASVYLGSGSGYFPINFRELSSLFYEDPI